MDTDLTKAATILDTVTSLAKAPPADLPEVDGIHISTDPVRNLASMTMALAEALHESTEALRDTRHRLEVVETELRRLAR